MDGSVPSNVVWSTCSIATATVAELGADGPICLVGAERVAVRLAVHGYRPTLGDTVLLARGSDASALLIAVLSSAARPAICAADGARAELTDEGVLAVYGRGGELLLEHDGSTGLTSIRASADDIELTAARTLRLRVAGDDGPTLTLDRAGLLVQARRTAVEGVSAQLKVDDARVEATVITTVADRARAIVGSLETRAASILTRARVALTEVEELAQTKAGVVRLIAREGFHVRSRRAVVKAAEDVKLKGQKIYLA